MLSADKKRLGWTDESVCDWFDTDEAIMAVKKKIDDMMAHGDVVDV